MSFTPIPPLPPAVRLGFYKNVLHVFVAFYVKSKVLQKYFYSGVYSGRKNAPQADHGGRQAPINIRMRVQHTYRNF